MFNEAALREVFSAVTGTWALVLIALVTLFKYGPAIKAKITEAKVSEANIAEGQYRRINEWCDKLERRVTTLESEIENCHRDRDAARAEAIKWKAIAEGVGENRQDSAALVAAQRLLEDRQRRQRQEGDE